MATGMAMTSTTISRMRVLEVTTRVWLGKKLASSTIQMLNGG